MFVYKMGLGTKPKEEIGEKESEREREESEGEEMSRLKGRGR